MVGGGAKLQSKSEKFPNRISSEKSANANRFSDSFRIASFANGETNSSQETWFHNVSFPLPES